MTRKSVTKTKYKNSHFENGSVNYLFTTETKHKHRIY